MSLAAFFTTLYRPLRLRGRSANTARLYACTMRAFSRFVGRDAVVADLDELTMAAYLEHRAATVELLTVEKERTQLCALAGLAWERRLIEVKPSCPPGPLPERIPTAWTVDELRRVFAAAADPATWPRDGAARALFFGALVPTAYETGERIGALLEAVAEDYARPTMIVRAAARKGRRRDRCYRLTLATCDRVDALLDGRTTGPVFAWGMSQGTLYNDWRRIKTVAGIPPGKRQAFHQIRRTAATHYAAAGGDAVDMLDHASPRTTHKWYLDARMLDRGARPCDMLPPIHATPGGGA
jgi:integrase